MSSVHATTAERDSGSRRGREIHHDLDFNLTEGELETRTRKTQKQFKAKKKKKSLSLHIYISDANCGHLWWANAWVSAVGVMSCVRTRSWEETVSKLGLFVLSGGDIYLLRQELSQAPALSLSHRFPLYSLSPSDLWPRCHCRHWFPSTLLCWISLMSPMSLPSPSLPIRRFPLKIRVLVRKFKSGCI